VHDINEAEPLAAQIDPGALLADEGYDADSFIDCLEARGIKAVSRKNLTAKSNGNETTRSTGSAFWPRTSSRQSNTSDASPPAAKRQRPTFWQACTWSARWFGLNDNTPQPKQVQTPVP
jgi:hypothetical protein